MLDASAAPAMTTPGTIADIGVRVATMPWDGRFREVDDHGELADGEVGAQGGEGHDHAA